MGSLSFYLSSLNEDASCKDYADMPILFPEVLTEEVGVENYELRLPPRLSPQVPVLRRSLRIRAKVRRSNSDSRINSLRKIRMEKAILIRQLSWKDFQFCTNANAKSYVKAGSSRKVHVFSLAPKPKAPILEPTFVVGEEIIPQIQEDSVTSSSDLNAFLNPLLDVEDSTINELEIALQKFIVDLNDQNFVACESGSCVACNLIATSSSDANGSIAELEKLILAATQTKDVPCETPEVDQEQGIPVSSEPHHDTQQHDTEAGEVVFVKEVIVIDDGNDNDIIVEKEIIFLD